SSLGRTRRDKPEEAPGTSNYQTNPNPRRHSEKTADRRRLEKLSIVRTPPYVPHRIRGGRAGRACNGRRGKRPGNATGKDAAEARRGGDDGRGETPGADAQSSSDRTRTPKNSFRQARE